MKIRENSQTKNNCPYWNNDKSLPGFYLKPAGVLPEIC